MRYVDQFSVTDPFQPFRILPVGKYSRFGRKVDITLAKIQEMAANFGKVPNTPLPINREHVPENGKVGDIAAVEARPDGLYMTPAWTEAGLAAVQAGDFQFFSPEIKWGPTDYDGLTVSNVLMGLALTNSPFFGKDTALYSLADQVEDTSKENHMSTMDKGPVIEALTEFFGQFTKPAPAPAPAPATVKVEDTEEYRALAAKNAEAEEKLAAAEKAQHVAELVEKFSTALKIDKFDTPEGLAEKFAAVAEVDEGLADDLVQEFRALVEQASQGKLFAEFGTSAGGEGGSDAEKFTAMSEARAKADGISAAEANKLVAREHPELYKAYRDESANRGIG